ncbi:MAG: DNA mismatch repair protein MutS [Ruminococcaceae bacterium]|nr:DNA mismatch repair protein MutS [Oscillospiraceae bacterium]
MTVVTPMMQQYLDVKSGYNDYVLMYRLGDFFECFFEDAVTVSRELELTLTSRDCGGGKRAAMCGVPFHKADVYIGKLVERGYKVAVCEQMENPAEADGIVRREVVRVVTPGTVTDNACLADRNHNYLAAVFFGGEGMGLAFADISTGEVAVTCFPSETGTDKLVAELGAYMPSEVLMNVSCRSVDTLAGFLTDTLNATVSDERADLFDEREALIDAKACFGERSDLLTEKSALLAVGALLAYIKETQMCAPTFVRDLKVYSEGQYMEMDLNTRRNLELLQSMRTKEKRGTLLWVLDKTETAMGGRLLRSFIMKPLLSAAHISHRQAAVTDFFQDYALREEMREVLSYVVDLERLTAKAVYGSVNAKELRAICDSLVHLPRIKELLHSVKSPRMTEIAQKLDTLEDLYTLLNSALVDAPPLTVREGGMIREGYSTDVDYLRSIRAGGEGWMKDIEEREREESGIKTLRVGYNRVFGYYIEVTKSLVSQVPPRYIRKQTLTGCERYITEELKDMEATVLGAQDKLCALEYSLFSELREKVAAESRRIQETAAYIAETDVYASFAAVAAENRYVCPELDLSGDLYIKDGRHPVVEHFVKDSLFVPNDTDLNLTDRRLMLITGPNMAGKSTYMRQVALITVMAQIGSYVPASAARLGVVDKVFTRVGASDDLASGQSTFMLEMTEVAHILKSATSRSLIIYDEVGRGTSTYDGMSIARAVAEYTLSKKIGAKTLFATHYHELTSMEDEFEGVKNYNVAAKKKGDGIVFLRRIVRGATDDSYGIDVAKLAGVPREVIRRANEILTAIEANESLPRAKGERVGAPQREADLFSVAESSASEEVAEKLRALDPGTITPIEALNLIYEYKKILG